MNVNDSEKMAGILIGEGYTPVEDESGADIVVVNTCSVREKAKEKLFSFLGKLNGIKKKREIKIVVTGCVSQLLKDEIRKRAPYVDIMLGTNSYFKIKEAIQKQNYSDFQFYKKWIEIQVEPILRRNNFSAYVSIMEGCDSFCTYCVVPFSRGREKFRPSSSILKEIRFLEEQGFKEIQLLGQNVDSYRDPETGMDFASLLEKIAKTSSIPWIRFLTSHPAKFSLRIAEAMAKYDQILNSIHLPFQAGSNKILKHMNRGYTIEKYLKIIEKIKEIVPDIAISTDVIVGFPGETDEDFERTVEVLKEVEYENMFSFKYSPRPGTKAYYFKDDVPDKVKTERLIYIQNLQKEIQLKNNLKKVGKILRSLTEGTNKKNSDETVGRIESGRIINIKGGEVGEFYDVLIEDAGPHNLKGRIWEGGFE